MQLSIWCRICKQDIIRASRAGMECHDPKCPYVSDIRKVERELGWHNHQPPKAPQ